MSATADVPATSGGTDSETLSEENDDNANDVSVADEKEEEET